jgi:hypothetical protein
VDVIITSSRVAPQEIYPVPAFRGQDFCFFGGNYENGQTMAALKMKKETENHFGKRGKTHEKSLYHIHRIIVMYLAERLFRQERV